VYIVELKEYVDASAVEKANAANKQKVATVMIMFFMAGREV
jgi:hypothetical protein